MKDKFSDEEKTTLEKKVEDALKWVESNPNAHAEEFEKQQKELESVFNPIISKVYQQAGGPEGGMPGGMPGGFPGGFPGGAGGAQTDSGSGPQVDEVD